MAPAGSRRAAKTSEYASITHSNWVWVACVLRAMSGSATLSDDMAATTVAKAMQITAVMIVWFELPGSVAHRGSPQGRSRGDGRSVSTGPVRGRQ